MLCKYCSDFNLDEIRGNGYEIIIEALYRGSFASRRSKSKCDLCDYILQLIFSGKGDEGWLDELPNKLPVICITPAILPVSFVEFRAEIGRYGVSRAAKVEIFCSQEDPIASILNSTSLNKELDSDECMSIASRWFVECCQQSGNGHQYCPKPKSFPMPSRVINVGPSDGSREPFLQETGGGLGHWVALSHCWGEAVPLTTTKDKLLFRKQEIKIEDLSLSFQDAVQVTRKLGLQHLWIDSLCIIQDSPEDWKFESGRMGQIYGQAVLCVAAEAAADSHEGIFGSSARGRAAEVIESCYHSPSKGVKGRIWFRKDINEPGSEIKSAPWISTESSLGSRAWTLQENFMAPRILRYSTTQLKWSCRTFQCTEDNRHLRLQPENAKKLYQFSPASPPDSHEGKAAKTFAMDCWYRIVNEFSSRNISRPSDRLPAIAGLAKEIGRRVGSRYVAGLWMDDIHKGLLWSTKGTSIPIMEYNGPSWSWASISCPNRTPLYLTRLFVKLQSSGNRIGGSSESEIAKRCRSRYDIQILLANIKPKSSDEYLGIVTEVLQVEGWCYSYDNLLKASKPTFHQPGFERSEKTMRSSTFCELDARNSNLWTVSELEGRGIIYIHVAKFLVVNRGDGFAKDEVFWALILEPVDGATDVYCRIGIAEISLADSLYAGWEKRTISIV